MFNTQFEKEEVNVTIQDKKYIGVLKVEVEVDYTPHSYEVRGSDNSTLEAPSGADVKVVWAESTIELLNDSGEDIGTLVVKGVKFLESIVDMSDIEFDAEDLM
jgi:hypothetical protein